MKGLYPTYKWIFGIATMQLLVLFGSCNEKGPGHIGDFKTGKFKTVLKDENTVSFAERNDSLQIETFEGKKDTFYIRWKNDFEYELIKKHPKNLLDSTPFYVKITGIKQKSYTFKAHYKGSNYKQEGTATKLE